MLQHCSVEDGLGSRCWSADGERVLGGSVESQVVALSSIGFAGGYSPAAKLVFLPVSASLLVVDLLVSVAADTVMFPIDLMVAPSGKPIRPLMDECD